MMEKALADGLVDVIEIGRGVIADPDLPNKARMGKADEINQCLRCHECAPADIVHLRCATNPRLGRESEIPEELPYAKHKKRVVVVGSALRAAWLQKLLYSAGTMSSLSKRATSSEEDCMR